MRARTGFLLALGLTACVRPATEGNSDVTGEAAASTPVSTPGETMPFPPPLSVRLAVTNVLLVLEEQSGKVDGLIDLRRLSADYRPGKGHQPEEVVVRLDLSFFAEDVLHAVGAYTALHHALQGKPWCHEVEDRPTSVMDGGRRIYVDGLRLHLAPAPIVPPPGSRNLEVWGDRRTASDLPFLVSWSGVQDKVRVGQMNTDPSTTMPAPGLVDAHLKFEPADKTAGFRMGSVSNLATVIESASGGEVVVTFLSFQPLAKTLPHERVADLWRFKGEATFRQAAD